MPDKKIKKLNKWAGKKLKKTGRQPSKVEVERKKAKIDAKRKKKVDVHGKARNPVENRNVNPEYDATHESSSPGSQTDGWQAREAEKRLGG